MATREQVLGMAGLVAIRLVGSTQANQIPSALIEALIKRSQNLPTIADVAEVDAGSGYAEWADDYDSPANPFFSLQERWFFPRLESERVRGPVLDVAGGTGRIASLLGTKGHSVTLVDRSIAMLEKAAEKGVALNLIQADYAALPAASDSFSLVVCSLALTHTKELDAAVAEFARVTTNSGRIIICDIHPAAVRLGWQAFFPRKAGSQGFVRNHVHGFAQYLAAFAAADLTVAELVEVPFDNKSLRLTAEYDEELAAGTVAAFEGLPALIVWTLTLNER